MGITVIPTNIGGVNINSIISPLASLLGGKPSAQTMTFPADLGSNPAMGHAVIIQAYDYKSGLGNSLTGFADQFGGTVKAAIDVAQGNTNLASLTGSLFNTATAAGTVATKVISAPDYKPITKGTPLATISLFMPETMAINYSANYSEVSLTEALGLPGMLANAYSDIKGKDLQKAVTPYAVAAGAKGVGEVLNKAGLGGDSIAGLIGQSLGVVTNPQMQLLFKGVDLREFQLEFVLTPKTAAEAETVKNICDSLAYFSLPGIAGSQVGNTGQFLTPPQVFSVKFQFLGNSGLIGQMTNAITGALGAVGLGFLTGSNVTAGKPSKTFTVNDCVLTNVSVDYAPNGWATYQDGHPVQTRLLLQFKETTIYTKDNMRGTAAAGNYEKVQTQNSGFATFDNNGNVDSALNPNAWGQG